MLAHQHAGVFGTRLQRHPQGPVTGSAQRVAHGHGHIAQPTLVPDAANGAAFGHAQKGGFFPGKKVHQLLARQPLALVKIRQATDLRKLVPGADELAVVTAINAVGQQGPSTDENMRSTQWSASGFGASGHWCLSREARDSAPRRSFRQHRGQVDGLAGARHSVA